MPDFIRVKLHEPEIPASSDRSSIHEHDFSLENHIANLADSICRSCTVNNFSKRLCHYAGFREALIEAFGLTPAHADGGPPGYFRAASGREYEVMFTSRSGEQVDGCRFDLIE